MALIFSFIFFIFSFLSNQLIKLKFSNPIFLNSLHWCIILFLYYILPHGFYDLQSKFFYSILIWVFSFNIVCYFAQQAKFTVNLNIYNKKVFSFYFYIVIFFAPYVLYLLIIEALKVGPELFFLRLRMINTGLDEDNRFSLGFLGYIFNFSYAVIFLYTMYIEKIKKSRYFILLIFVIFLGLITLARTSLVTLLITIFFILNFKNKLNKKKIVFMLMCVLFFLVLLTLMRSNHLDDSDTNFSNTISGYLLGGLPAFDTINDVTFSNQFGEYSLRFFYALSNSIFGTNFHVAETILPYTLMPKETNVYTVMFPFYKDFGYIGVLIFGSIYGLIYGKLFNGARLKSNFFILLYSIFLPYLFLQFIGEFFFTNLSTYLQYIIFLLIPFFFNKLK